MKNMRDLFNSDFPEIHIDKPIRLIELFGGYGSQSMALERIGADFEPYFLCEFDEPAVRSYNAVHGTNFKPSDIRDVHGADLKICDTDKYFYLLTYSFPCTDLSVAGKMAGMAKGSGTRSGLLWEVERILRELYESGAELPQCLFMENVPQVTSEQNAGDFNSWRAFLQKLGYTSYLEILNAKDYGVAQNRERAFMFSFLGEVYYEFPKSVPLEKRLKDYLEDEVDEKYYLKSEKAQELISQLVESGELEADESEKKWHSDCVWGGGIKICTDGTISNPRRREVANCIKARYDCGISNLRSDGTLVVENADSVQNERCQQREFLAD